MRLIGRVAGCEGVGVVGRRQGGAVFTAVAETADANPIRAHDEVTSRRKVAVDAPADPESFDLGLDDVGEAPERGHSPAGLGREELPVAERVAEDGIRDVVGRDSDAVDPEQRLTRLDRRQCDVDQAGVGQVVARNLKCPGATGIGHDGTVSE